MRAHPGKAIGIYYQFPENTLSVMIISFIMLSHDYMCSLCECLFPGTIRKKGSFLFSLEFIYFCVCNFCNLCSVRLLKDFKQQHGSVTYQAVSDLVHTEIKETTQTEISYDCFLRIK